jgi:signal transduction histidine kinase
MSYGATLLLKEEPASIWRAADQVTFAALWCVTCLLGIALVERYPVTRRGQYGRALFHFASGGLVAVLWTVISYYVNLALVPGWLPLGVYRRIIRVGGNIALAYWVWVVLVHAVIHARLYRQRELRAVQTASLRTEAQLQVLKMELQPHFLFNTLHSISALMYRDVRAANAMLVLLADMLRRALDTARAQEVTLAEELETLRIYVDIEQIRFGDRLEVVWNIDPDTLPGRVPHMTLQPLFENAIRHGLGDSPEPGRIEVASRCADGRLYLTVRDNGRGLGGATPQLGIGLSNTGERLAQLYGGAHNFKLEDSPGGGAVVSISFPYVPMRQERATPRQ